MSDDIRLLITGGDRLEREALAEALDNQEDLHVVGAVEHGAALARVAVDAPHVAVVLYDDASHLDLCQSLTRRSPSIDVVLADSFRSVRDFAACEKAGALGFVHRNSPVTTMTEAVRAVAGGGRFYDPDIPDEDSHPFGLTDREFEVLANLEPGRSNRDIAERLYVTEGTVKYHLKHIFDKLQIHRREEAMAIAIQEGIVKVRAPRRDT